MHGPAYDYRRLFLIGLLCYQSAKFMSKQGIQTHAIQIIGLGALAKWLASQMLVRVSAGKYTVKKVSGFHVPSRDVTNQTLPGRE
jgi:hypothetical protein